MCRRKQMDAASYQAALDTLAGQGYDVSRFQRVPQREETEGTPRFSAAT
jgi:hypothetical protein